MTCPVCAEALDRAAKAEEQVAYLKSELGLRDDLDAVQALKEAFGLYNGEAFVLHALYAAHGRTLGRAIICEHLPLRNEERGLKIVDVYASRIRSKLGKDSILNSWGEGYRISPEARRRCTEVIARHFEATADPNKQPPSTPGADA
jgi:DNA-binding response OmpR family regulator